MLCAVVTKRTKCGGLWWCLGCPRGLKILGSRALRAKPAKAACPRDRAFLELHPACSHRYRDPGTTCRTAEYRGSNGTPPTPDPIQQLGKAGNFHKVDHWWAHSQKKDKIRIPFCQNFGRKAHFTAPKVPPSRRHHHQQSTAPKFRTPITKFTPISPKNTGEKQTQPHASNLQTNSYNSPCRHE